MILANTILTHTTAMDTAQGMDTAWDMNQATAMIMATVAGIQAMDTVTAMDKIQGTEWVMAPVPDHTALTVNLNSRHLIFLINEVETLRLLLCYN